MENPLLSWLTQITEGDLLKDKKWILYKDSSGKKVYLKVGENNSGGEGLRAIYMRIPE